MADVFANSRSILHKGDGLQQISGVPDVCKTPSPAGPIPIPYPNIAMDSDLAKGTKKVKINGKSVATEAANLSTSTGDEPGTAGGGIISSKTKGKLTWGSSSTDVKAEGNGVARFMDVTQHNGNVFNSINIAIGNLTDAGWGDDELDGKDCVVCGEPKTEHRIQADKKTFDLAMKLAAVLKKPDGDFEKAFRQAIPSKKDRKKGVMLGVLVCKCANKVYAAISGDWFGEKSLLTDQKTLGFQRMATVFRAEAKELGLTPVTEPPMPPPRSGMYEPTTSGPQGTSPKPPPFGAVKSTTYRTKLMEAALYRKNLTTEKSKAFGCAAPKVIQECLLEGHKPGRMIEIWVAIRADATTEVPIYPRILEDKSTTPPIRLIGPVPPKKIEFKDGAVVPSCETCQILLTMMLCKRDQPPCA